MRSRLRNDRGQRDGPGRAGTKTNGSSSHRHFSSWRKSADRCFPETQWTNRARKGEPRLAADLRRSISALRRPRGLRARGRAPGYGAKRRSAAPHRARSLCTRRDNPPDGRIEAAAAKRATNAAVRSRCPRGEGPGSAAPLRRPSAPTPRPHGASPPRSPHLPGGGCRGPGAAWSGDSSGRRPTRSAGPRGATRAARRRAAPPPARPCCRLPPGCAACERARVGRTKQPPPPPAPLPRAAGPPRPAQPPPAVGPRGWVPRDGSARTGGGCSGRAESRPYCAVFVNGRNRVSSYYRRKRCCRSPHPARSLPTPSRLAVSRLCPAATFPRSPLLLPAPRPPVGAASPQVHSWELPRPSSPLFAPSHTTVNQEKDDAGSGTLSMIPPFYEIKVGRDLQGHPVQQSAHTTVSTRAWHNRAPNTAAVPRVFHP